MINIKGKIVIFIVQQQIKVVILKASPNLLQHILVYVQGDGRAQSARMPPMLSTYSPLLDPIFNWVGNGYIFEATLQYASQHRWANRGQNDLLLVWVSSRLLQNEEGRGEKYFAQEINLFSHIRPWFRHSLSLPDLMKTSQSMSKIHSLISFLLLPLSPLCYFPSYFPFLMPFSPLFMLLISVLSPLNYPTYPGERTYFCSFSFYTYTPFLSNACKHIKGEFLY